MFWKQINLFISLEKIKLNVSFGKVNNQRPNVTFYYYIWSLQKTAHCLLL